jgi:hypothetical protein
VNDDGQVNVPGGLSGVTAVAGNNNYCMALKSDTTVALWGRYPSPPGGLNNIVAIAAGETHALALNSTKQVIAWGAGQSGATTVPASLTDPFAIAASWHYSAALSGTGGTLQNIRLTNPRRTANSFWVSLNSELGTTYVLEYKNALTDPSWTSLGAVAGNGSTLNLTNSFAIPPPRRIYRVRGQ